MIAIEIYTDTTEAYNAKALLETNGICCQLRSDALSAEEPFGKIELLVRPEDVKLARDVLANAMNNDGS